MSLNCRFGITPADAGKTIDFAAFNSGIADHPRGCGENYSFCRCCRYNVGSPPRMRGKQYIVVGWVGGRLITPADAGKTTTENVSFVYQPDHPRRCGENLFLQLKLGKKRGSPPQVRGKPIFAAVLCWRKWITPAGAGKTRCRRCIRVIRQDHPRRCGENIRMSVSVLLLPWITPAGAGKTVFERAPPEILLRITPAGAGKT